MIGHNMFRLNNNRPSPKVNNKKKPMINIIMSEETVNITQFSNPLSTRINIFSQFFLPPNKIERQREILHCLKKNVMNRFIHKIYLLNERIYTELELQTCSDKVIQVDIGKRLQFKDVFNYINENKIEGFNVLLNIDIFLDDSIHHISKSDISIEKKMFALSRYEYNPEQKKINLNMRFDSQDTWIVHSNFTIPEKNTNLFDFEFGRPGCDNKIVYLMDILGYKIINDPKLIKSYHYHLETSRNYSFKEEVCDPYGLLAPCRMSPQEQILFHPVKNIHYNSPYLQINNLHKNHNILYSYLVNKLSKQQNFIIPRIQAGAENSCGMYGEQYFSNTIKNRHFLSIITNNDFLKTMKNNAGIYLKSIQAIHLYSNLYMKAFRNSEIYGSWGGVLYDFKIVDYMYKVLKTSIEFNALAFDVFHYIYNTPWTFALRGKRLLIISPFEDSIQEKIPIRDKLYDGVDLFPECTFITLKPPQTQGVEPSRPFEVEFKDLCNRVSERKDEYDIALVSCGGYGNPICNYIYESGKSAIYVGGVLQMYFGIIGSRWEKDRPDIVKLFVDGNPYWSRPKPSEVPKGHKGIEDTCYW
jgi:hypothetical protein